MMKRVLKALFPANSFRRKFIKKILEKLHLRNYARINYYNTWAHQTYSNIAFARDESFSYEPLITVIVPAYNTTRTHFYEMVYSVVSQAYKNWELIIINASTEKNNRKFISSAEQIDVRIKVINTPNKGIAGNTNEGIKHAKGEYIAFVDHDDLLDPFALLTVVGTLQQDKPDLIYSDEDKISDDREIYFDPHFKPDWSPDLLTHVNYINHLTVVSKKVLAKVGPLDPSKDGAQDYDLLLRITDATNNITHISKVLYHWRAARTSTAQDFSSKSNVTKAGQAALAEHFARTKTNMVVEAKEDRPGFYALSAPSPKAVSIIITPFVSDAALRLYTEVLFNNTLTSKVKVELIVPIGAEPRKEIEGSQIVLLPVTEDFLKAAVSKASHDTVIIINQVLLPFYDQWLESISGLLILNHVFAIAPLIIRGRAVVEDCGLVRAENGELQPLFINEPYLNNQTFFGNTDWVRDVDALSGGFILTKKRRLETFLEQQEPTLNIKQLLKQFSLKASEHSKFNMVYTDVLFETHSIRLKPLTDTPTYFNLNLSKTLGSYEIYTPETTAVSILLQLQEQDNLKGKG
jgi:hypothetical protein